MDQDYSSIEWLKDSIAKWCEANKDKNKTVEFSGTFFVLNPDKGYEIESQAVIAWGIKETLLKTLDIFKEELSKEEEEFVNW